MIDQVGFDAEVSLQHVCDEPLRKFRLVTEELKHRALLDNEYGRRYRRGRCPESNGLTGEGAFPEEIARPQHRHDRFFAGSRQHRDLDAPLLNVQDRVTRLALRKDDLFFWICRNAPCRTGGLEKSLGVEDRSFVAWLSAIGFCS